MATTGNVVCRPGYGKASRYVQLPDANDALIVVVLQWNGTGNTPGHQDDQVLRDHATLASLLGAAANKECTAPGYCVTVDTECLTRRAGWTKYADLRADDELLAYDPKTHTTRWERPVEIYANETYSGPMWSLASTGFSAMTTPGHRWPVRQTRGRARTPEITVLTTETLPEPGQGGHGKALLRSAPFDGPIERTYSDAFVRVAAWYYTEGNLCKGGTGVAITQSDSHNPQHVDAIRRDLKAIGAVARPERPSTCADAGCDKPATHKVQCRNHYVRDQRADRRAGIQARKQYRRSEGLFVKERTRQRDRLVTWELTGTEVDEILACVPGKRKIPTMKFLSALTADQAAEFVEVCIAADGTPEGRRFYQHDSARMDAFSAVAVLAGKGPTLDKTGTACSLNERVPTVGLKGVKRTVSDYQGLVWCPVLPKSGHWVARHAGKVHITGNSRGIITAGAAEVADDTNNRVDSTLADYTFPALGVMTGTGAKQDQAAILLCYRPTSSSADSAILPLMKYYFPFVADGSDRTVPLSTGFLRATGT